MAIMGRKKRAIAQGWNAINKQRDEESEKQKEKVGKEKEKEISPEEHKERIRKLKEIGLLKD